MKLIFQAFTIALAVSAVGNSQTAPEFDAVAIKAAAPSPGHFASPASSRGGPGTADPTLFRCTNCNLAFLISKAFGLQRYQFPGQMALPDTAFDISARVADGVSPEQFTAMLRNLLKDRFSLTYHFEKKQVQGFELAVANNGPTLKDAGAPSAHQDAAGGDWHSGARELTRPGLMVFGGQGKYRGEGQTTADLARMLSDQLAKPVDDHTGLQGKYDISLSWSDDGSHAATHAAGGPDLGGHGDHGGAPQGGTGLTSDSPSGPTLIGAVRAQLGLQLEPMKATANVFIVDKINSTATPN